MALLATDLRTAAEYRPGQSMKPLPIKMLLADHARLHVQAERLNCYPSALARALVLRGLDQLDGEVG